MNLFLGKFGPKIQNCLFKVKFDTKSNLNMQNFMVVPILSVVVVVVVMVVMVVVMVMVVVVVVVSTLSDWK